MKPFLGQTLTVATTLALAVTLAFVALLWKEL